MDDESGKVPDRVIIHVKLVLSHLWRYQACLNSATKTDRVFNGDGLYYAQTWSELDHDHIEKLKDELANFCRVAQLNGINGRTVIREFGGEPALVAPTAHWSAQQVG